MDKTMVMKILEQKRISYTPYEYNATSLDATFAAKSLGEDPNQVFKTLVTTNSKRYFVFMVPANKELDLKLAAKNLSEKKIEMIPQKELYPLTGYVHGGCSPIGMKKQFPTYIDASAANFETIIFSAGKIGHQVEVKVTDLVKLINARLIDIAGEKKADE